MIPLARACATDSSASAAADSLMAGVIPVMWNQLAPSNAVSQLMSPGFARLIALYSRS